MNAPSCKARNTRKCWKKRSCEIRVWKNLYYFWQPAPEDTILIYNCYRSDRRIMYVNHFNQIYRHIICKLFQHTIIDCEFSFRVSSERKAYNFKMLRNLGQSTAAPDLKKIKYFQIFWVGHMLHFELAACSLCIFPHRGSFSPLCLPNKPHSLLSHLKGFLSTFLQILRHLVKHRPQEY